MVGLLDLPPECTIHILLFLAPHEIARCNLVSRSLWRIINDSPRLQYLLELERLGFMVPHNLSNRLSLDEKVQALKQKRLRMYSLDACDSAVIPLNSADSRHITTSHFLRYYMFPGVLALDQEYGIDQLGIYRLSSRNRDIEFNHHLLKSLPLCWMIAIEPAFDLIVLFDFDNSGQTFHLRSLQTGLPHPATSLPTVFYARDGADSRDNYADNRVVIIGRRIAFVKKFLNSFEFIIKIWDWPSGQIILSTTVYGTSLAFLSESVFLVTTHLSWGPDAAFPLLLYTCDGIPPDGEARPLAQFHLPKSVFDTVVLGSIALLPAPVPSVCRCDALLASPPLVYDLCPTSFYMALKVGFVTNSNYSYGTLFIHSSSLLSLADTLDTHLNNNSKALVPWSEWNSMTSWIGRPGLETAFEYGPSIFGHLASFMHADEQTNSWRVEIYDLRTAAAVAPSNLRSRDSSWPVKSPALVKSFAISFETIPWTRDWDQVGQSPIEIMIDDEHVVILQVPSNTRPASIHIYPL